MSAGLWTAEFGLYQWIQYGLHLMPAFTAGMHIISQAEVGGAPKFACKANNQTFWDAQDSCHYVSNNETFDCVEWVYDDTDYTTTIVTEWNLVCDRRWMAAMAQSIYMLGCLIAATVLGELADRYGRRTLIVPTGILQVIFAIGCAFADGYATYTALRFFTALNAAGCYMIGFVMTMEMTPDRYRSALGFSFQLTFALGIASVAGWGHAIRDWRVLQIVYGLHGSFLLFHFWLVDESPRWLFAHGRYTEADGVVRKMLARNGNAGAIPAQGYFDADQLRNALGSSEPVDAGAPGAGQRREDGRRAKTHGIVDLFRTPRLRLRTFNVAFNWFANSLVYYGLSLNTGSLLGDPHLMLFLTGIIEVPAYVVSFKIIDILGRRSIISACLCLGGVACIAASYFPQTNSAWTTATVTIVMLGKSFIAVSFAIVYNYTAELFPTVVRSSAVGVGSSSARLAGMIAPQILLLDSFDSRLPSILFGSVALASGILSLCLPETNNRPLMHTIEEGEDFGRGDTVFSVKALRNKSPPSPTSVDCPSEMATSVTRLDP